MWQTSYPQTYLRSRGLSKCSASGLINFKLIPRLFRENKDDSLRAVASRWSRTCDKYEMNEPAIRMAILLDINYGTFDEKNYEPYLLAHLEDYRDLVVSGALQVPTSVHETDDGRLYRALYQEFNDFTSAYAKGLMETVNKGSIEHALCQFYSNQFNEFDAIMKTQVLSGTTIKNDFDRNLNPETRRKEMYAQINTGLWIPSGSLRVLGWHPNLGVRIGNKIGRFTIDYGFSFGFIRAPKTYTVLFQNAPRQTNVFRDALFDIECGFEILRIGNNKLCLLAGGGFEGIQPFAESSTARNSSGKVVENYKSPGSANISYGIGQRVLISDRRALGFQIRYNSVHFKNPGGTDLSGSTLTVRVAFFGIVNPFRRGLRRYTTY